MKNQVEHLELMNWHREREMTYIARWADPSFKIPNSISLAALASDTTSTSLTLTGKGRPNYGEGHQQNAIRLLENFCSDIPPLYPTIGQLWYDRGANQLKLLQHDGDDLLGNHLSSWKVVGGATVSPTAPPLAREGDLWYDTTALANNLPPLKYYTGTQWIDIIDGLTFNYHTSDDSRHLTAEQNTLLDTISAIISPIEMLTLDGITGNIQLQFDALTMSNAGLNSGLLAEANTRANADNDLQTALNAEILARINNDDSNYAALLALINGKVSKAGDDMSGYLTLINSNPTNTWHAVPKQYLDNVIFNAFSILASTGGVIYQREYETAASVSVTTSFDLPINPLIFGPYTLASNNLFVFVGGTKQINGLNYTESLTTQATFTVPLNVGTVVTFEKMILGGGLNVPSVASIDSIKQVYYTATANQITFNVPSGFVNVVGGNILFVWVNGVKQIANTGTTYSYSETTTQITFNTPLPAGTIVELIGFNLSGGATIQRNVVIALTGGQTQFTLSPSINPTAEGTWTFVSGVLQSKAKATVTSNGYAVILSSGVTLGTLVEVYTFKVA